MQHIAIGDYILVKDLSDEKLSKGGLILVDGQAQADSKASVIVSVSEKIEREQTEDNSRVKLEVGDTIYHSYHTGIHMKTEDDQKLRAVAISSVLCVVKK